MANRCSIAKAAGVLQLLSEGVGVRACSRITGVATNTIVKLIRDTGAACERRHREWCKGIGIENLQADELTAPVQRSSTKAYSWLAIDPDTKFVVAWTTGGRSKTAARAFLDAVKEVTSGSPTITTDCFAAYRPAIEEEFGSHALHVAMRKCSSTRLSDRALHTSFVERLNLTVRTMNARFARRSPRSSKAADAHHASLTITLFAYNYIRTHATLGMTPAMAAGVSEYPLGFETMALLAR